MWNKFHLYSLIISLLLYLADLVTAVYVAFQHHKNGDETFSRITIYITITSVVFVNIFATASLNVSCKVTRFFLFLTHLSMTHLLIVEILRCKKESDGDKAHPCGSRTHFSKCDCDTCKKQLEESVRASLETSYVRSMQAVTADIPQWLIQVLVMLHKQSYPWYAMLSVALSFLSLLISVCSFEKTYWSREILTRNENYVKPASFPNRSAVVFVFWQTLLLLGRLSAFVALSIAFVRLISTCTDVHWLFVMSACFCMFILSNLTMYPLIFHDSYSSYAGLRDSIPRNVRCSNGFVLISIPCLLLIYHCLGGNNGILDEKKNEALRWYIGIFVVNLLAFVFQTIFYSSTCHPLQVTYKRWEKLQDRTGVEHMGVLTWNKC